MALNTARWNRIRYTLYAPLYDVAARVLSRPRRRAVEQLGLNPGEKVLIAGAGTGLDLDYIPGGVEITAVDITPAMVKRLRRRAQRLGRKVDIRVMNAESLDFEDQSFDAVILHLVLAVLPNPDLCASEAARVLKDDGRISIFDKFLPPERDASLLRRGLNVIIGTLFTDINRRLGPILGRAGLQLVRREGLLGDNYVIAQAEKKPG